MQLSKNEMPFVAQTVVMGGNPRVGLEDNLYISKGKLATNAQLVEKSDQNCNRSWCINNDCRRNRKN